MRVEDVVRRMPRPQTSVLTPEILADFFRAGFQFSTPSRAHCTFIVSGAVDHRIKTGVAVTILSWTHVHPVLRSEYYIARPALLIPSPAHKPHAHCAPTICLLAGYSPWSSSILHQSVEEELSFGDGVSSTASSPPFCGYLVPQEDYLIDGHHILPLCISRALRERSTGYRLLGRVLRRAREARKRQQITTMYKRR